MVFSRRHPKVRALSFQRLLTRRVGDLDLWPEDTFRECLIALRHELQARNISFYPHIYFGEEPWGCIDGTASVEIPFYLANNELRRIAERYYVSYTKLELMMLLRHETGHAILYSYRLWKRDDWKRLFGNFHRRYLNFYDYDPHSKDFVRYLHYVGNPHYAQKHPDDDFAETFAVWLDPGSKWKWNYRKWPGAREKLSYVERLFRREGVAERRPLKIRRNESGSYRNIVSSVAEYFEIERKVDPRLKEYAQDLKEIFPELSPRIRNSIRADLFIQNYSEYLEGELVTWIAGADRRDIRIFLREVQIICALNNLRLRTDQSTTKLIDLVILSTYYLMKRLHHLR